MLVEDISLSQIITAIVFLTALIAIQIYISKNKNTLRGKWVSNQRIKLTDSTRISPTERVQILNVDGSEYLYFYSKGNQPVIVPITPKPKDISIGTKSQDTNKSFNSNRKPNLKKARALPKDETASK